MGPVEYAWYVLLYVIPVQNMSQGYATIVTKWKTFIILIVYQRSEDGIYAKVEKYSLAHIQNPL